MSISTCSRPDHARRSSAGRPASRSRVSRFISRVSALLVVAIGIVAGLVTAAPPASAATWSPLAPIPSAFTYVAQPALATYGGDLYAAWAGSTSPYHVFYSAYDGSTWSPEATIPSALTTGDAGPALAEYGGDLYAFWVGQSSPYTLWYSAFNGTSWTHQASVPYALTQFFQTPGLAAYDGNLYLSWIGQSSPYDVWYADFNGSTWSRQATIPSSSSESDQGDGATLAFYGGDLYAGWIAQNPSPHGAVSAFNGSSWSAPTTFGKPAVSPTGPNFGVNGSDLDVAIVDQSDQVLYYSYDGKKWSGAKTVKGATSSGWGCGAAIAEYGGSLFVAWDPTPGPTPIDYSHLS